MPSLTERINGLIKAQSASLEAVEKNKQNQESEGENQKNLLNYYSYVAFDFMDKTGLSSSLQEINRNFLGKKGQIKRYCITKKERSIEGSTSTVVDGGTTNTTLEVKNPIYREDEYSISMICLEWKETRGGNPKRLTLMASYCGTNEMKLAVVRGNSFLYNGFNISPDSPKECLMENKYDPPAPYSGSSGISGGYARRTTFEEQELNKALEDVSKHLSHLFVELQSEN